MIANYIQGGTGASEEATAGIMKALAAHAEVDESGAERVAPVYAGILRSQAEHLKRLHTGADLDPGAERATEFLLDDD